MASFSKELPLKYQELDYDGVIGNYNWIKDAITSKFENVERIECTTVFKIGDISCSCESIEEFSEYAYGQSINVYSYDLVFYQNNSDNSHSRITHIIIKNSNKILIAYCDSMEILIKVCTALEDSMKSKQSDALIQSQINNYIHDESTHVTMGNHSTIQGVNIGKNNVMKTNASAPKESFWKSILQTITANWMWFLLGLILAVILGYLGISNSDWMNIF